MLEANRVVFQWRSRIKEGRTVPIAEQTAIDESWLPVPATLVSDGGTSKCILSWSPGATFYHSISDALASAEAASKKPDLANQAKYYLECTLARLHGVGFGPDDYIVDESFALTPEVQEIKGSFTKLELERIADARFGRLDRFGR
ncbi:MAG TPA: hypothetical protein VFF30_10650 [Nitrososphaerales archaeon]|nr:hypothetical protein [Nitrososphaerales archaeon]